MTYPYLGSPDADAAAAAAAVIRYHTYLSTVLAQHANQGPKHSRKRDLNHPEVEKGESEIMTKFSG